MAHPAPDRREGLLGRLRHHYPACWLCRALELSANQQELGPGSLDRVKWEQDSPVGIPGGLANELPAYKGLISQMLTSLSCQAENKLQPNASTMTFAPM